MNKTGNRLMNISAGMTLLGSITGLIAISTNSRQLAWIPMSILVIAGIVWAAGAIVSAIVMVRSPRQKVNGS